MTSSLLLGINNACIYRQVVGCQTMGGVLPLPFVTRLGRSFSKCGYQKQFSTIDERVYLYPKDALKLFWRAEVGTNLGMERITRLHGCVSVLKGEAPSLAPPCAKHLHLSHHLQRSSLERASRVRDDLDAQRSDPSTVLSVSGFCLGGLAGITTGAPFRIRFVPRCQALVPSCHCGRLTRSGCA